MFEGREHPQIHANAPQRQDPYRQKRKMSTTGNARQMGVTPPMLEKHLGSLGRG